MGIVIKKGSTKERIPFPVYLISDIDDVFVFFI